MKNLTTIFLLLLMTSVSAQKINIYFNEEAVILQQVTNYIIDGNDVIADIDTVILFQNYKPGWATTSMNIDDCPFEIMVVLRSDPENYINCVLIPEYRDVFFVFRKENDIAELISVDSKGVVKKHLKRIKD